MSSTEQEGKQQQHANTAALARKKRREKMSFGRSASILNSLNGTNGTHSSPPNILNSKQKETKETVPPKKRKFNPDVLNSERSPTVASTSTNAIKQKEHGKKDGGFKLNGDVPSSLHLLTSVLSANVDLHQIPSKVPTNDQLKLPTKSLDQDNTSMSSSAFSPKPSIPPTSSPSEALASSPSSKRKRSKKAVSATEIAKAKEIRMLRNRASAAAHRQRNRDLIETLQKEVELWKSKYSEAINRQHTLELELEGLKNGHKVDKEKRIQLDSSKQERTREEDLETRNHQLEEQLISDLKNNDNEQGIIAPGNTSTNNDKKGPVWKKLINVFTS